MISKLLRNLFKQPNKIETDKTIEIYTWQTCPYCWKAKKLLDRKGLSYQEYSIDGDEKARALMTKRAGGKRTVPQVFVEDQHLGGCDDLHRLESSGELDQLLLD